MMTGGGNRWIILQTSSGRTLPLCRSLTDAHIQAWSPRRTIWRPAQGQRRRTVLGLTRHMIEVDVPILPGFVFAREEHIDDLVRIALSPATIHPAFSVFQFAGRAPLIGDAAIAGLLHAEAEAMAAAQAKRDAISREEERRSRANQMRTERERRKALRSQRKDFALGERVGVIDMPAFSGIVGEVVKSAGTTATIDFGGLFGEVQVEAWRVIPSALLVDAAINGIAA